MTRAQRLAKAAAWERMAARVFAQWPTFLGGHDWEVEPVAVDDLHVASSEHDRLLPFDLQDWWDVNLMSLHCLSEAARLRSGVPV